MIDYRNLLMLILLFSVTEYIGSCGYLSGKAIDSIYNGELDVTCCNGEPKACGDGVSCETICGSNTPGK